MGLDIAKETRSAPLTAPLNPGATAVPTYLPLGFIAAGIAAFVVLVLGLIGALPLAMLYVRHNQTLLVLVHLFTLTWGSGVTLGVLHQMTPVIVSAQLYSVRLGWVSLGLFVPGSLILALSFGTFWTAGIIFGGICVIAAVLVVGYNMLRTMKEAADGGVTQVFLRASLISLIAALLFGVAAATSLRLGAGMRVADALLTVHLFLGAGGWFTGVIIGVSYKLAPMFLLVHGVSERRARAIVWLLYSGVVLGILGAPWKGYGVVPGLVMVSGAMLLYAYDFSLLWRVRGRRPDIWMRQVPWALAYGMASVLGPLGAVVWETTYGPLPPRIFLAAGLLFALGWVSVMIVALLHKIIPFLVWFHRYGDVVGRVQVPTMSALTNEKMGTFVFPVYHATLIATVATVGIGVQPWAMAAGGVFAVSGLLLLFDLIVLILPVRVARRSEKAESPL